MEALPQVAAANGDQHGVGRRRDPRRRVPRPTRAGLAGKVETAVGHTANGVVGGRTGAVAADAYRQPPQAAGAWHADLGGDHPARVGRPAHAVAPRGGGERLPRRRHGRDDPQRAAAQLRAATAAWGDARAGGRAGGGRLAAMEVSRARLCPGTDCA